MSTPTFQTVAVIGAGAMGRGIAQIATQSGSQVLLYDTNADQVTASDLAIREARNRVDGVKDVVPIYVRPNTEDSNTLQNNNTAISNYANNQIAKWVQKGGIDKEWDAYVKKVSEPTLGLDANIKIWQKWYDKYTK